MKKICFVGNCQTFGLAVFFYELLDASQYDVKWICFGEWFHQHLNAWSKIAPERVDYKCPVIMDDESGLEEINNCDILVYQCLTTDVSRHFHTDAIRKLQCQKISIPSIHFDPKNIKATYEGMKSRELQNNIDIPLSDYLLDNYEKKDLMLSKLHPTTDFFLHIVKEVAREARIQLDSSRLNIKKFSEKNYLEL